MKKKKGGMVGAKKQGVDPDSVPRPCGMRDAVSPHTHEKRMTSSSMKVYITEQCITHFARPLYAIDRNAYCLIRSPSLRPNKQYVKNARSS